MYVYKYHFTVKKLHYLSDYSFHKYFSKTLKDNCTFLVYTYNL